VDHRIAAAFSTSTDVVGVSGRRAARVPGEAYQFTSYDLGAAIPNRNVAAALGALTGLVSLVAMIRLVSGAFVQGMSTFAWVAILLAMLPWIGYAAGRGRHGHLSRRGTLGVLLLNTVGSVVVWLSVLGPVVALASSLAAFVVIWVSDWPPRRPRGEERFVRIEELRRADD
jgi:hypothetical protein